MRPILKCAIAAMMLLAPLSAPRLHAQGTGDIARLVVGVSGGYIGGHSLWRVTQPVPTFGTAVDTFRLDRGLRSNISLTAHVAYFPTPRFGVNGELSYLGLGTVDNCVRGTTIDDPVNRLACAAIAGDKRSASAIAMMAGGIWRPLPSSDVQPYLKGQVGLGITPRSTTAMTAFLGRESDLALQIYVDENSREFSPAAAAAIGFSTAPKNGYQFSLEFRATAVRLRKVVGPAPLGSFEPQIGSTWAVMPTITVGFDIVLERRRGRRY